ncbi:MAG: caspase family protein [Firmicutes bacterium]|jgi:hypothetical protein|nr:caspase family protein [Bacillota bacterium]
MNVRRIAALLLLVVVATVTGCGCIPSPIMTAIDGYVWKHADARSAQANDGPGFGVMAEAPKGPLAPLSGANVVVEGPTGPVVATSNRKGYFKIGGLTPGYYEVTITHEKYLDVYSTSCYVEAGRTTSIGGTPMLGSLHILAIGINDYQSDDVSDLSYAVADAELIVTRLGVENRLAKQYTLLTAPWQTTKSSIQNAIRSIGYNVTDGDTFIMFYSGHGAQNDAKTTEYIVPSDASLYTDTMISDQELNNWINQYMPQFAKKIFIFDSCNSGGMYKSLASLPTGFTWSTGFEVMARNIAGPCKIVMTACDKNEKSYETKANPINGHGVFTWALTEGMRYSYPADGCLDGHPRDGAINTEEAYYYASYWTQYYSPGVQHPQIYRGESGLEWWYLFTY